MAGRGGALRLGQRVQRLATKDARALAIRQEVYNAVDSLDTAWQRILAARLAGLAKRLRRPATDEVPGLAELVCSNSLRSDNPENAVGLLHEELRRAGSLLLRLGRGGKMFFLCGCGGWVGAYTRPRRRARHIHL